MDRGGWCLLTWHALMALARRWKEENVRAMGEDSSSPWMMAELTSIKQSHLNAIQKPRETVKVEVT